MKSIFVFISRASFLLYIVSLFFSNAAYSTDLRLRDLEKSLSLNPSDASNRIRCAAWLARIKEPVKAYQLLKKGLIAYPNNPADSEIIRKEMRRIWVQNGLVYSEDGLIEDVRNVAISNDGQRLEIEFDGLVILRDPARGKTVWNNFGIHISEAVFLPDGKIVANGCFDGALIMFGRRNQRLEQIGNVVLPETAGDRVRSIYASPYGNLLTLSVNNKLSRRDTDNLLPRRRSVEGIARVFFLPDGKLITMQTNLTICYRNPDTLEQIGDMVQVDKTTRIIASPDKKLYEIRFPRSKYPLGKEGIKRSFVMSEINSETLQPVSENLERSLQADRRRGQAQFLIDGNLVVSWPNGIELRAPDTFEVLQVLSRSYRSERRFEDPIFTSPDGFFSINKQHGVLSTWKISR